MEKHDQQSPASDLCKCGHPQPATPPRGLGPPPEGTSVALWATRETYEEHVAREHRRFMLFVMGVAHAGLSAPLAGAVMAGRLDLAAWALVCMYAVALQLWLRALGPGDSYNHRIEKLAFGGYRISWTVDFHGGRLRYTRDTDEDGAKRFAKKWGIDFDVEGPNDLGPKEGRDGE